MNKNEVLEKMKIIEESLAKISRNITASVSSEIGSIAINVGSIKRDLEGNDYDTSNDKPKQVDKGILSDILSGLSDIRVLVTTHIVMSTDVLSSMYNKDIAEKLNKCIDKLRNCVESLPDNNIPTNNDSKDKTLSCSNDESVNDVIEKNKGCYNVIIPYLGEYSEMDLTEKVYEKCNNIPKDNIISIIKSEFKLEFNTSIDEASFSADIFRGLASLIDMSYTFKSSFDMIRNNANKLDILIDNFYLWSNIDWVFRMIKWVFKLDIEISNMHNFASLISTLCNDRSVYRIYKFLYNLYGSDSFIDITPESIRSLLGVDEIDFSDIDLYSDHILDSNLKEEYKRKLLYILITNFVDKEKRYLEVISKNFNDKDRDMIKSVLDDCYDNYQEYLNDTVK